MQPQLQPVFLYPGQDPSDLLQCALEYEERHLGPEAQLGRLLIPPDLCKPAFQTPDTVPEKR
jgi:hypothetical protein